MDNSIPFAQWLKESALCTVQIGSFAFSEKPVMQRIWAYQAVGMASTMTARVFEALLASEQRMLVEHLVYDDFYSLTLSKEIVWRWCDRSPTDPMAQLLVQGAGKIEAGEVEDSLITTDHNAELLRWVLRNRREHATYEDLDTTMPVVGPSILRIRTEDRLTARMRGC